MGALVSAWAVVSATGSFFPALGPESGSRCHRRDGPSSPSEAERENPPQTAKFCLAFGRSPTPAWSSRAALPECVCVCECVFTPPLYEARPVRVQLGTHHEDLTLPSRLQGSCLQTRPRSEVLGVKTSACEIGGHDSARDGDGGMWLHPAWRRLCRGASGNRSACPVVGSWPRWGCLDAPLLSVQLALPAPRMTGGANCVRVWHRPPLRPPDFRILRRRPAANPVRSDTRPTA